GLWYDGQSDTCTGPNGNLWTYNQMGAFSILTGEPKYLELALVTLDAVVDVGTASGSLPQSGDRHLEVLLTNRNCNNDQKYFKGAFMKHLQYFLDNTNNTVRDKYAGFVGAQASAVIHFGTRADGQIGEVWYAPDAGGSVYDYITLTAGLDALNCAQKVRISPLLIVLLRNFAVRCLLSKGSLWVLSQ
ncbi:glycoside hydrolase family 76 protein, partial [Mycena amicta]